MGNERRTGPAAADAGVIELEAITRELAEARDVAGVLHRIAALALRAAGAAASYVERIDGDRAEVEIVASAGRDGPAIGARVAYPGSLAERVIERGGVEVVELEDLARRPIARILPRGAHSDPTALVVPLRSESMLHGALCLLGGADLRELGARAIGRLRILANLSTLAARHGQHLEEVERRAAGLEASERRFRLLVEHVEDHAICMLDPEGFVENWNPGAKRLEGYDEAEVVGAHFAIFYPPEERGQGRPEEVLETAAREGRFEAQGWRVRRDGTRFWARVVVTAIRDEAQRLVGFAEVTRDLTARRDADAALREVEERFHQLTDNAREVFWLLEAGTGLPVYVSPAYETVWGRSVAEVFRSPRSWYDFIHPDDRERVRRFVGGLRHEEETIEYRITRPDGAIRWISSRGFPIRDPSGEVVRIGGISDDVTEQREAAGRLRFLAEAGRLLGMSLEYRQTLRTVARLAVPYVADWCVVDVLEEGEINRLGVAHADPTKEQLAWEVARRFPPDPEARGGVAEVLRTGEPRLLTEITLEDLRQAARDEEHARSLMELGIRSAMIVPLLARGRTLGAVTFIGAESGHRYREPDLAFAQELAGRAALAVDNARLFSETEEARGEAERRAREEAALRRATEAVTASFSTEEVIEQIAFNSLAATGADGSFVERIHIEVNEVEVVAVAGEIVPKVGTRASFSGSYAEVVIEGGEAVLVPDLVGATHRLPDSILAACGSCSAMVVPLLDGGEAIGALALTRKPNRHGFRPDEMERARTFADLAALAFRKVHLLHDSEQRREELEAVMESRARLIRGFSHDLKNPLGAADGYLELIESGVVSEATERELSIARARRAIRSALGLIQDLTEMARAEAGQIEVRTKAVDLREIAREMTEEYRAKAESKNLHITWQGPAAFPVIRSDASRIRQVLGNLISNAVKYTESGGISVQVMIRSAGPNTADDPSAGPDRWAVVRVVDTGRGIGSTDRGLLFREFTRIDPGGTEGAGLGLAISQRLAHALGGCITIESEPGEGSTFTLWLPFARPAREP